MLSRGRKKKQRCAEKVAEDIAETLGCELSAVSVAIIDVPREEWKEKVLDVDIIPNEKYLYIKPGYTWE